MRTLDAIKNLAVAMGRFNSVDEIVADNTADAIQAIASTYTSEVTFSTTPAETAIVVKKGGVEVAPVEGKYLLAKGSYTYTATAEGYVTQEDVALSITQSDVNTGSKTVTVTMVES